jgi:prevent-host-death family protein
MITVGIRELRRQASELIRLVREEGSQVQVTYRGKVVAMLTPVGRPNRQDESNLAWAELDQLAAEIGARWPADVSASEAVADGRR